MQCDQYIVRLQIATNSLVREQRDPKLWHSSSDFSGHFKNVYKFLSWNSNLLIAENPNSIIKQAIRL